VVDDIEKALLEADVNVELARTLCERIKERTLKEKAPPGLSTREHVLRIVYEELVSFLGKGYEPLKFKEKPFLVLAVGLLGSGKTTSCIKLARYFQKQGHKVGVICADPYRPASLEQLQQLGKQAGVPVYGEKDAKDVIDLIRHGIQSFKRKDVIIIDTAGRHKRAHRLMEEMKSIYQAIKPHHVLLVVDATIGQAAKVQAEAFHRAVPVGSILVAKLDGTARGGGVLSACAATGAKIDFIGIGEKVDDLEVYRPQGFVSRMLGLGDLESLLEKARKAEVKEEVVERFVEAEFTLQDFYEQLQAMQKMGPLTQLIQMIPGIGGKVPEELLKQQEEKMRSYRYIIDSMTPEERANPNLIDASRIRRIAKGCGRPESEVRELLQQYKQARKLLRRLDLKRLRKGQIQDLLRRFGR
jgi:signal recognition particle subunit SRP54